jgi:hypothetical protein
MNALRRPSGVVMSGGAVAAGTAAGGEATAAELQLLDADGFDAGVEAALF